MRYKVQDPLHQLANVLDGSKVKPMITQCCMAALYSAEKATSPEDRGRVKQTIALAKEWERRKCNHKEPLPPGTCLEDVIGPSNKHRYVLAADDPVVRRMRRRYVPGLPILHYSQSVLVLEPMSDLTERHIAHMEANKSAISPVERQLLEQHPDAEAKNEPAPLMKRKRPKGPNPLSVKKSKTKKPASPPSQSEVPSEPTAQQTSRRRKKRGRGSTGEAV